MEQNDLDDLLLRLFERLRVGGLRLGIGELLAARRAVRGGFGPGRDQDLKRMLRFLWCKSLDQNAELDAQLDSLLAQQRAAEPERSARETMRQPEVPPVEPPSETQPREPPRPAPELEPRPAPAVMPLPVRAPQTPASAGTDGDLVTRDPISRRAMAYTWRYLRRRVKDGPRDQVDLPATVERVARQGFFDCPVLERRVTDHAHLILLVDQGGSMVPFHRLTRDLVQTAAASGLGRVETSYFQNVPPERVYEDPHRTRPLSLEQLLTDCGAASNVLLVSDAGAARGSNDQKRFQATARLLVRLKGLTGLMAWLNPVPASRWPSTTAQLIAMLVDMFPMDEDGFSNAVDVLRGQPLGSKS